MGSGRYLDGGIISRGSRGNPPRSDIGPTIGSGSGDHFKRPQYLKESTVLLGPVHLISENRRHCFQQIRAKRLFLMFTLSQLSELGVHEELVASDVEDMIAKATKLASDSSYRENLSTAILGRKAALSDPRTAIKEWEQFLQRAVKSVVHPVMQT